MRRRQFVFGGGLVGLLYLSGCRNLFHTETPAKIPDQFPINFPTPPLVQAVPPELFKIYPEKIPAAVNGSAQEQIMYYINLWNPWVTQIIQSDYTRTQERISNQEPHAVELRLQSNLILPGTFRKLGGMYAPSSRTIFISSPTVIHHELAHALWDPANNILFGDRYQGISRRKWEDLLEQRRKDSEWSKIMQESVEQESRTERLQTIVALMNSYEEDVLELCRESDSRKGTLQGDTILTYISNDLTRLISQKVNDAQKDYSAIPSTSDWNASQRRFLEHAGSLVENMSSHTGARESLNSLLETTLTPAWIKYANEYTQKGKEGYETMVRKWLLSDDEIHARLVQSLFACRIRGIDDSEYPLTDSEFDAFKRAQYKTRKGEWVPMFLNPTIRYDVARRKNEVPETLPHATLIVEKGIAIELPLNGFYVLWEIPKVE